MRRKLSLAGSVGSDATGEPGASHPPGPRPDTHSPEKRAEQTNLRFRSGARHKAAGLAASPAPPDTRRVVLHELLVARVRLAAPVRLVPLHLELAEPRQDDVLDVLHAGVLVDLAGRAVRLLDLEADLVLGVLLRAGGVGWGAGGR